MTPFTRLRQICLVANNLEAVVRELAAVFAIEVCHRDPNVARYGLINALLPIGTSFLEVVAPIAPGTGTAAGRYLLRRGGDGGYMVINDCDDVARFRDRATALGIRVAEDRSYDGKADLLQLHPRDTGGAILEFDRHTGGEWLDGAYHWAGADWQSHVRTTRVAGAVAVVIQSDEPAALAARWAAIYGAALDSDPVWTAELDNAALRFVSADDGRGEGLAAIELSAGDVPAIVDTARRRGLRVGADGRSVEICGVRFDLRPHPVQTASSSSG